VIGREFSYALIAALSPLEKRALQEALSHLVGSELVFRRGTIPDATYSFKHAFVQDAAYGSLLKSRRQQLHARIAEVLEDRFPEQAEALPEILAHLCSQAGFVEKAINYWYRAGRRAMARSAMAEAVAQLNNGLEVLEGLPAGPESQRPELDLQLALGQALIAARGFAAPETGRAYARACELCRQVGNAAKFFQALYGKHAFHFERAELHVAYEVAQELLQLAEERDDGGAQAPNPRIG
jgi:predicted ATPase